VCFLSIRTALNPVVTIHNLRYILNMMITVSSWGNIKKQMGMEEVVLELTSSKVCTVLEVLREIDWRDFCGTKDIPNGAFRVLLNNKMISSLEESNVKVRDGDSIKVFPLLGGG
jgi:molybdopterin converting factor small subunit